MKNLSDYENEADLVTNLFSSFGYFHTDEENFQILKNFYDSLKPGGHLALSTVNREWLLSVYSNNDWTENDSKYILNKREYDSETSYNKSWMTVIDKETKEEKTYFHQIRLYSKVEMVQLLEVAGFIDIKVFGDETGNAFNELSSSHPIYIATKPQTL